MFAAPFTRRLTVALLVVTLAACSTVRIAYYGADFFDLIAKWPVTVESIPGEGQEPPFLAPFRVLYVISH
jgi:hypothetical protein